MRGAIQTRLLNLKINRSENIQDLRLGLAHVLVHRLDHTNRPALLEDVPNPDQYPPQ